MWRRYDRSRIVDVIIVLTAIVTLSRYVVTKRAAASVIAHASPPIQPGGALQIEGIDWSAADRTIVVLISPTCPACNASGAFYQRLTQAVRTVPQTRLVFIAAEPTPDVRAWLQQLNLASERVVEVSKPAWLGFFVVPSLVIVDRHGVITDLMANRLTDAEQISVLARVAASPGPALNNAVAARELSGEDFDRLIAAEHPIVLDVRSRDAFKRAARSGSINIPMDELQIRAPIELAAGTAVAIDCADVPMPSCRQVGMSLTHEGGRTVWLLPR
jgi:hypothetical protein